MTTIKQALEKLEKFERLRSRQKQVLREIHRAAKEESVSEEEAERVFAEVAEKYRGTLERLERYDRGEVKAKGYKIIFSTTLSDDEIEGKIDAFLREVDAKEAMAHAEEMTPEEITDVFRI